MHFVSGDESFNCVESWCAGWDDWVRSLSDCNDNHLALVEIDFAFDWMDFAINEHVHLCSKSLDTVVFTVCDDFQWCIKCCEVDSLFFCVFNLFFSCWRILKTTAVDNNDLSSKTSCASGTVHSHVTGSDNDYLLSFHDWGVCVVWELVSLHQVAPC